MSSIKVKLTNSNKQLKMFVKENYKLVSNKKLIKKMKEDPKIQLPPNYAFDKNFSKFIKIRNGKKYTKEYSSLTKIDKKKLKYYGTAIYDTIDNKVISSADFYKKKLKDGKQVKKKKYKNRILVNNQAKFITQKKAKEIMVSVTFYVKAIKKIKNKNGEEELREFEASAVKNYSHFTNKTKKETITARIREDALAFLKKIFSSQVVAVWNGKKISWSELQTKFPDINPNENNQYLIEQLLKNGTIKLDELVDISNISNQEVKNPIDESEFDLNSFIMTLDGETPHDWDTKTDRCVYDFLIHRYGNQKGLIKQMNYLNLYNIFHETNYALIPIYTEDQYNKLMANCEEKGTCLILSFGCFGNCWDNDELAEIDHEDIKNKTFESYDNYVKRFWGVSPTKINNFCKKFSIPHYALDKNKNKIIYFYPEKKMKACSLAYRCFNGHLNPIEDPNEIKSIARLFSFKKNASKKTEETEVVKQKYELQFVDGSIDRFQYISNIMMLGGVQVIDKKVKMNKNNISSFILGNTKYIFNDEKKDLAKQYCELNNIAYNGESITKYCNEAILNYVKNTESNMNNEVHKLLFTENVKNRTHIGNYDKFDETHLSLPLKCWDIVKCYSKCITEPSEKWIKFNFNSIPRKYKNQDIELGLYYVETDDIKLFHKSNFYSSAIVKHGLKEKIIQKSNIKFVIKASTGFKKDLFHPLFKHYKDKCKDNIDLNKQMNNLTTGMLGITINKESIFNASTECNDAYLYLRQHPNDTNFLRQQNYEEGSIFIYGGTIETQKYRNNLPMYIQILDESNIRLYDMIKKATNNDFSKLEYRKTDCCVVRSDIDLNVSKIWGDYQPESNPRFRFANSYDTRNVVLNLEEYDKKYTSIDITDSADWEEISTQLKNTGGLMINGSAGTGKSHIIKNISKKIGDDHVAKIAFTNCAAINIQGRTIHNFLKLNENNKITSGRIKQIKDTIKLIIVDEISMVNSELWSILYEVHNKTKIPFLLVGDWKQIEPVEPEVERFDYKYHPAVLSMSKNTIINLEVDYRCDLKIKELSNNVMDIEIGDVPQQITRTNLCYTNKTRKFVNNEVMSLLNKRSSNKRFKIDKEVYTKRDNENKDDFIKRCNDNPTQDLELDIGFPVIARSTIDGGEFCVNNEQFTIIFIDENKIILENVNKKRIEVAFKDFVKQFLLAFCITIHKSQGMTIDRKICIWDWDHPRMSEKLKYTAITRVTKYKYLNIRT